MTVGVPPWPPDGRVPPPIVPARRRGRARDGEGATPAEPFEAPSRTYPIGHLSREFGVTTRTLRYYEEVGLLAPDRQGGVRRYSSKERARLVLILQGRAVGMSLAEVGYLLDLYQRGGATAQHDDAMSIFQRQLRLLEARRAAAEQGIAMLRSAIDQLSGSRPAEVPGRRPERWEEGRIPPAALDQQGVGAAPEVDLSLRAMFVGSPEEAVVHGG